MVKPTIIIASVVILVVTHVVSTCFITNCPPGGKRSSSNLANVNTRQCARCGPGMSGRCYGSRICCDPRRGCVLASTTEVSLVSCLAESMQTTPCRNRAPSCGPSGAGQCASQGVCCLQDSCHSDLKCHDNYDNSAINLENNNFDTSFIQHFNYN